MSPATFCVLQDNKRMKRTLEEEQRARKELERIVRRVLKNMNDPTWDETNLWGLDAAPAFFLIQSPGEPLSGGPLILCQTVGPRRHQNQDLKAVTPWQLGAEPWRHHFLSYFPPPPFFKCFFLFVMQILEHEHFSLPVTFQSIFDSYLLFFSC